MQTVARRANLNKPIQIVPPKVHLPDADTPVAADAKDDDDADEDPEDLLAIDAADAHAIMLEFQHTLKKLDIMPRLLSEFFGFMLHCGSIRGIHLPRVAECYNLFVLTCRNRSAADPEEGQVMGGYTLESLVDDDDGSRPKPPDGPIPGQTAMVMSIASDTVATIAAETDIPNKTMATINEVINVIPDYTPLATSPESIPSRFHDLSPDVDRRPKSTYFRRRFTAFRVLPSG